MKNTSKSLEHAGPDPLDPALANDTAPVISQKLKSVKHEKTAEPTIINIHRYTIGDSLLYYKTLVYTPDRITTVHALLDCGASYTFVSIDFLKHNNLYQNRREISRGIHVRIPNGKGLISRSIMRLPITLEDWSATISV